MANVESFPKLTIERIEEIGSASAVIGLLGCESGPGLLAAVDAVRGVRSVSGERIRTVILYPETLAEDLNGDFGIPDDSYLFTVPVPMLRQEFSPASLAIDTQSLLSIASASRLLDARACCLWSSGPGLLTPEALQSFFRAVDQESFDLAVPRYAHLRFGNLINSAITYPLTRALYGRKIRYPLAPDLCCSPRVIEDLLRPDPKTSRPRPPQWITNHAVCLGFRICQVDVPFPPPSVSDSLDLSTVLSIVLGSLFLDIEQNASFWQRTRGAEALPTFGEPVPLSEEKSAVEVRGMIEGFQLAFRNLGEIWGLVLPPGTLLELKKMTRMPPAEFRLSDPVWARIVYDFVLAHRQRVISRDHLLRALTPIYLAWVASYALEVKNAPAAQASHRLEQLALAYEAQKPYLLSRWRWPDRFNP